jgi:hypothetical protein
MPNTEQPMRADKKLPTEERAKKEPEGAAESAEERVFHPHRHGHVSIRPASTGVTHLDPGVVTFS